MANFKEARAEHVTGAYGPFLQTGHFAEPVTVRPRSGSIERTITVTCEYDQEVELAGDVVGLEKERLWVFCLKDESAAKGGVAAPEVGDRLLRAGERADAAWGFAGQVRGETPTDWELLFERARPRRYGPAVTG